MAAAAVWACRRTFGLGLYGERDGQSFSSRLLDMTSHGAVLRGSGLRALLLLGSSSSRHSSNIISGLCTRTLLADSSGGIGVQQRGTWLFRGGLLSCRIYHAMLCAPSTTGHGSPCAYWRGCGACLPRAIALPILWRTIWPLAHLPPHKCARCAAGLVFWRNAQSRIAAAQRRRITLGGCFQRCGMRPWKFHLVGFAPLDLLP